MKKNHFFSLVLFLVWAGASAQIKLNGVAKHAETKQPLPGIMVKIDPGNASTSTRADGLFTFTVTEPGNYTLTFTDLYFEEKVVTVYISIAEKKELEVHLTPNKNMLRSVEISALRATKLTPMSFTNVQKDEITRLNNARDIPYLLEQTASVVATSDAGNGIGYTNLRVRGSDITRINVTVNGIPINDAESHGVFWVNMPDIASSTGSMQLQRGVGTSSNGAGAFGATLNLETDDINPRPNGHLHLGGGSFNTQRATAMFGTGLINNHWWMNGRLSQIKSDGFVDRGTADLNSYYLSGGYLANGFSIKAIAFGGRERTYQTWYGLDSATFATNPSFNFAGGIYDDEGNIIDFYENQVDNYAQDHYQLHINKKINSYLQANLSLHYTYGRGYFEEYWQDQDMAFYGINPVILGGDTITTTDLVRRKWLDNDFYGMIANLQYTQGNLNSIFGGGINRYDGRHFGEIIWARFASQTQPEDEFYRSLSNKTDWNVFWKNLYTFTPKTTAFVDIQLRGVNYNGTGKDDDVGHFSFEQNNIFFNPKAGITHVFSENKKLYASYAVANREPNRVDFLYAEPDREPQPERLQNVEIGFDYTKSKVRLQTNFFYMYYTNQLVLTGRLDAVGNPIRENIGQSYRTGIELIGTWQPLPKWRWDANLTLSRHRNVNFISENEEGQPINLGNTNIAFAPAVIGASNLAWMATEGFTVSLFSKYVGEQFLSNEQNKRHKLPAYFLNDLRFSYVFQGEKTPQVRLYVHLQNLLDVKYANNGYVFFGDPYFYAQAGRNFLAGLQLDF